MKRWIGSLVLAGAAVLASAQGGFNIVRPADGSKVREKVRVLLPKGSIPPGGYVGVFLNGKFLEARGPQSLVPESKQLKEKYLEYVLDTKALGIKDSQPGKPDKLEMVLYVDFSSGPRIVERSSVDVYVGNKASIPIPANGLLMRYAFAPGSEQVYKLEQKISLSTITQGQNARGGRANEQEIGTRVRRLLYAVDNRYENGDGLLRIQALPDKGKDYTMVTMNNQTTKWMDIDLAPFYTRTSNVGMEVWGSMPLYFGFFDGNGTQRSDNLYSIFPLPALPSKAVRIGDSWQTGFLQVNLGDKANWHEQNTFTTRRQARGEFTGVEWENGHPCAVIHNSVHIGETTSEGIKLKKAGASLTDTKLELDEYVWFSLDTKKVLKLKRTESTDVRADQLAALGIDEGAGSGGENGNGQADGQAGGPPAGFTPPTGPGGPNGPRRGGVGGGGGTGNSKFIGPVNNMQRGAQSGPGPMPGGPSMGPGQGGRGLGGPPGSGAGMPGFGQGRFGGQQQQQQQLAFIRVKIETTFTLED